MGEYLGSFLHRTSVLSLFPYVSIVLARDVEGAALVGVDRLVPLISSIILSFGKKKSHQDYQGWFLETPTAGCVHNDSFRATDSQVS